MKIKMTLGTVAAFNTLSTVCGDKTMAKAHERKTENEIAQQLQLILLAHDVAPTSAGYLSHMQRIQVRRNDLREWAGRKCSFKMINSVIGYMEESVIGYMEEDDSPLHKHKAATRKLDESDWIVTFSPLLPDGSAPADVFDYTFDPSITTYSKVLLEAKREYLESDGLKYSLLTVATY